MSSKFVEIVQAITAETGEVVFIKEDPQEGSFARIVNNRTRKQIAEVYLADGPVRILTKRVDAQHTMNCLQMQEIDYSEPFHSINVHRVETPPHSKREFEDSVYTVTRLHQNLSRNGYRLWETNMVQQYGSLMVRNVYINSDEVQLLIDDNKWDGEVTGTVLEAHLVTTDFSELLDTNKFPNVFWDIRIDQTNGRVVLAERIDPHNKYQRDVIIKTSASVVSDIPPINAKIHHSIRKTFEVAYVTGLQLKSNPGRVDTLKNYRCVDDYNRPFNLLLRYNI